LLGASERTEAQEALDSAPASASLPEDKASLISDLVFANRILFDQGVVDGYGHVSVRHPTEPNHFLISRWLAPDLVTENDILELNLDCHPVAGDRRRLYSER
jgi:ribulose-5-phosphate 4-epimerase/fuculose-1-phosphate aldolase